MRKLAAFALAFAGAVLAAVYVLREDWLLPLALVCGLGSLAALFFPEEGRWRAALIALGLGAGLLWYWGYDRLAVDPARAMDGQTLMTAAVVEDFPKANSHGWTVAVRLKELWWCRTVLYTDADCVSLAPGDTVTFTAKLRLADTLGGEESRYYFSRGVYLTAFGRGEMARESGGVASAWYLPAVWAQSLRETAEALFLPEEAGLFSALLTGERSGLEESFYAALKRCGLAHVVAVSGMHLNLLAGMAMLLDGRKNRRRRALLTIPAVVLFMAMTGFPASVVRAGIMELTLLLAGAVGREEDWPTALSAALLALLAHNPNAAADVGLQLSFAAVVGIRLFSGRIDGRLTALLRVERTGDKDKPVPLRLLRAAARFATGTLAATLGAMVFTTPLTVAYFGYVSLIAPLANLLCLWAVTFAFTLGAAAVALGCLWLPLGRLLAPAAALPARYLLWLALGLAKAPFAAVPMNNTYLWLWLGFVYVLLAAWLLVKQERKNPLLPLAAGAVGLAAALGLTALTFTAGDLTVTVLDVGQGLSVALHSEGHTVIVDCGGSGADDPGDVAADYVQSLGGGGVDLLVLTHYHTDHANGVERLLERVEVRAVALPDVERDDPLRARITALAADRGVEVFFLTDDADAAFGQASLHIYAPLGAGDTNEEGLSVLVSCGDFDALITGDMGASVERRLVKYGHLPDTEVLVVGHHGSRYASSETLLLAAAPEYAVISVGNNTYGHPAEETLERLAAAGCAIYRTDWMGSVTFTVEKEGS